MVVIPTHREMVREDMPDLVFRTEQSKYEAVTDEIGQLRAAGRPILVGTASVESSERLSNMLGKRRIPHEVLNAKQHEREAHIIAAAGEPGAVTIATNMAGRGTDIKLGSGVAEAGGLAVVGTERHESRRIDNQLRGRAGRQGDPGSSRFFCSFEDGVMKRFTPDWLPGMLEKVGLEDGQPLESGVLGKSLEQAQQKVETYHFDIRKHLVDYDDVINRQREVVYAERDKVLNAEREGHEGPALDEIVGDMLDQGDRGAARIVRGFDVGRRGVGRILAGGGADHAAGRAGRGGSRGGAGTIASTRCAGWPNGGWRRCAKSSRPTRSARCCGG